MNKILFVFLFLLALALPASSKAQMAFGGLDVMEWPCICLPPFEPIPPVYALHLFVSLYMNGAGPSVGSLLSTITGELPLTQTVLHPGAWVLGSYAPSVPICGIFYVPPVPPYFPGLCVLWTGPIYGIINPAATGSSV